MKYEKILILIRAERDRASIYSELQQTRGAVEQIGREKVQWSIYRPCTVTPCFLHLPL